MSSTMYVGWLCVVGRDVSTQPPWSMATSMITARGGISFRSAFRTRYGARAPFLIRRDDLKRMVPRAVIVDVAIDQGGCVETSRPTTHSKPTYIVDDVVHYCVTNMPGAVGRTSTYALTNVTLPYVLQLADKGFRRAVAENPGLAQGVNVEAGRVVSAAVAQTFGLECASLSA